MEANRGLLEDRQKALEEKRNELDEIMQETREEEGLLKDKASELETKIESDSFAASNVSVVVLVMVLVSFTYSVSMWWLLQ